MCGAANFFNFIMSEEQALQISQLIDKEVEVKRRAAWGGFGVELYHKEIALQLRAQEIIKKLIEPQSEEQLLEAEAALATVKKDRTEFIEDRKNTTARFISVTKRLMLPEGSIDVAITSNEAAILKTKKDQKEAAKKTEDKEKELKQIGEQVRVYVADMHAAYLSAQLKLLTDAYEHALKTSISIEALPEYLKKIKARLTVTNRTTPAPVIQAKFNTQGIVDEEIKKHFNPWQPKLYIDGFAADVDLKFDDWALALKNKEQAAKINSDEFAITTEAIADQKEKEVVSAKLESIATPVTEQPAGKALKEVYKLDDPQTIAEAMIIINAFTVNQKITIPELTKIQPINFGVKQMKAALESVKNKDNNFQFTGLAFKIIEKL